MPPHRLRRFALLFCLFAAAGCAAGPWSTERPIELSNGYRMRLSSRSELMRRILRIDPESVTPEDVATLAQGPAPWILPIAPAFPGPVMMKGFLDFLVEMGYPRERIGDPRSHNYNIYYTESSKTIAGLIAWLYERDGLSPMIMGWSAGGIVAVAALHDLDRPDGLFPVKVVNGLTGEAEDRTWITDPYTGQRRPIRGVQASFAGVLASGGWGRVNQFLRWGTRPPLRSVPDSVREMVAFVAPFDLLGTDFLLLGSANEFKAMGKAQVRTALADPTYGHVNPIHCDSLSRDPEGRKWVEAYRPGASAGVLDYRFSGAFTLVDGKRNLWCGEFWHGVRKNWAIEAQRAVRALLATHAGAPTP